MTGTTVNGFVVLFSGFVLGALLWCLALPVAIGWGRRVILPAVFRGINALAGLTLGYFSARLLWETLHVVVNQPVATGAVRRGARRPTLTRAASNVVVRVLRPPRAGPVSSDAVAHR